MTKNKRQYPQLRFKGFDDDWKQRKFEEFFSKVLSGNRLPKSMIEAGNMPYVIATKDNNGVGAYVSHGQIDFSGNKMKRFPSNSITVSIDNPEAIFLQTKPFVASNVMRVLHNNDLTFNQLTVLLQMLRASTHGFDWSIKFSGPVIQSIEFLSPSTPDELEQIGKFISTIDDIIAFHQRKLDKLKELKQGYLQKLFPKQGEKVPELRFKGFDDAWEQRTFGDLYKKNLERNNNQFKVDRTISIATMRFRQEGNGASENSLSSYRVLREGDIAFEGHTSKKFAFGRFVLNDIGDGIMSPRFTTLRPNKEMPIKFWKQYIHYEPIMRYPIVNSTKLGTMMNELVVDDFLKQCVLVPSLEEQKKIGHFFQQLNNLVTLHQRELDLLEEQKKGYLQKMFC